MTMTSDNLEAVQPGDGMPTSVVYLTPEERTMLDAYRDMRRQVPDTDQVAMLMQIVPVSRLMIDTPERRAAVERACRLGASRAMVAHIAETAVAASPGYEPGPG